MSAVAFDTLKFARALQGKAKLTAEQAEGIAEAFADATGEQLATKTDVSNLATKADVAEVKAEILKWMFGQTLLILGAVIALSHFGR